MKRLSFRKRICEKCGKITRKSWKFKGEMLCFACYRSETTKLRNFKRENK